MDVVAEWISSSEPSPTASPTLVILLIQTFAANSTTAIIFLIVIQLEDIISRISSLGYHISSVISAFTRFSLNFIFQFRIIFIHWFDWLLITQLNFFWRPKESWLITPYLYFTQVLRVKPKGCIISRIVMYWYILPLLDICVVLHKFHRISNKKIRF